MADNRPIPPLPIIAGPTGSGKTALALKLAESYPIEIISADSRQIIRQLDIGTSKPTRKEQERVRFHLIDRIEPGESYSAFRFIEDASLAIETVLSASRIPLVVGGTGLYLRGLVDGLVEMQEADIDLRQRLEAEMVTLGSQAMWDKLEIVDSEEAARVHPNNKVRILRALEIFYQSGLTKSELTRTGSYKRAKQNFVCYALAPPRELLYERINERVDRMIENGLIEELEGLAQKGLAEQVRRSNVIGYAELLEFLDGNCSQREAVAMIKQNSRRFAKRQMTWFRKQPAYRFFESPEPLFEELREKLDLIVKSTR